MTIAETSGAAATAPLVDVRNVVKHFPAAGDWFAQLFDRSKVHALDDVSFQIPRGSTLGIVGESGSGKSTIGKIMVGLTSPTSGSVVYDGHDLTAMSPAARKAMRQRIQMIFQDPSSSLNRRKTAGQIVREPLQVHGLANGKADLKDRISYTLERAGLSQRFVNRYPHELSGGQRQRIGIARALAVEPEFIVCDEPVTALDVSIQAQILNLMLDLQRDLDLTYVFISHDLSVVRHVSDYVAVMYLGEIVELAETRTLFAEPKHPYTQALMQALPTPDPTAGRRKALTGEIPSPITPPSGCRFHTRCPAYLGEVCHNETPGTSITPDKSQVRCHLYGEANRAA
jgi:oligopeptide/dipeptide ABC transporter ATP-binding protein